jgi:dihydroorotate dehydrogenase (fumarate)
MVDLSTTYLGLNLASPLVPSASPMMRKVDNIRRMEDAGAAAVVLHSLFEEQIALSEDRLDYLLNFSDGTSAEAVHYFPDLSIYNQGPEGYLEHIRQVKAAVEIPVIGSLNGVSSGGWIDYARLIEQAGADALELNMYYVAAEPAQTPEEIEQLYLDLVRDVKSNLHIPVAVKLGHNFTAFANFAHRLVAAGANGLVLFNRFYQPDIDLENLEVLSDLNLSSSYELRLRLRWIALLYGRLKADLAVTGGVHTSRDVLKSMLAGASVVMMTSALLEHGIEHLRMVLDGLREWMDEHEYESVKQMQGSMSQQAVPSPALFERANYMRILQGYRPVSF